MQHSGSDSTSQHDTEDSRKRYSNSKNVPGIHIKESPHDWSAEGSGLNFILFGQVFNFLWDGCDFFNDLYTLKVEKSHLTGYI